MTKEDKIMIVTLMLGMVIFLGIMAVTLDSIDASLIDINRKMYN